MKYIISFVLLLVVVILPGGLNSAQGFTLSSGNVNLGESVFINNVNPNYLYSIFWINGSNPNNEACSYIYGQDLSGYFAIDSDGVSQWVPGDNDLSHYGCFNNDAGTFKIVELSNWGFASNYPDSLQSSEFFVSFETLVVH